MDRGDAYRRDNGRREKRTLGAHPRRLDVQTYLGDDGELKRPDRPDGLIVALVLRHYRRTDRSGRESDQHVGHYRVTGLEMEASVSLQATKCIASLGKDRPRRHQDPPGLREGPLDAPHEAAIR